MKGDSAEEQQTVELQAIRVKQPLGEFFIASISSSILCQITYFDVRRMLKERDVETYLGIQRPLSPARVEELQKYVRTFDACFPTAVILAVEERCAHFDEKQGRLILRNDPNPEGAEEEPVYFRNIAKVLDGQHRIAGLHDYPKQDFEVNVSIFVGVDIEDQAYIFSTVNLAQTKVNKSLAYDLFELSKTRSPQKTCHNIAVALDREPDSPLYQKIKRLGSATAGRKAETLTQATVVAALLPYMSRDPITDRDTLLRGGALALASESELQRCIFRNFFIRAEDIKIADILWNYFSAVQQRWPAAWDTAEAGAMLKRTNGFRAFMRVLRPLYLSIAEPGEVPDQEMFLETLKRSSLEDKDFTTDRFVPGSTGEGALVSELVSGMALESQGALRS